LLTKEQGKRQLRGLLESEASEKVGFKDYLCKGLTFNLVRLWGNLYPPFQGIAGNSGAISYQWWSLVVKGDTERSRQLSRKIKGVLVMLLSPWGHCATETSCCGENILY
jgi:hypothetical protein